MKKERYIKALLNEANAYKEGNPSDEFVELLSQISDFEESKRDALLLNIAQSLKQVNSPIGAGLLAVWFGGFVENGKNPEPFIPYLLKSFLHFGSLAVENKSTQNIVGLEMGLQYFGQSLVALLARSSTIREELSEDESVLDKIENIAEFSSSGIWIEEVFKKVSDSLLVIHAQERVGVRVQYKNISNCFHLFSLLQECIADVMPGSKNISDKILQIAKTGEYINEDDSDEAWWHYGQAFSKEADMMSSVFGEPSPHSISRINGEQVILLWEPILSKRIWDCDFCRPYLEAMPPSVELIDILTENEVDEIFKEIEGA